MSQDAILKLVEDNSRVASQYEKAGDATTAAAMRAVANMVACLLRGEDAGTLYPALTEDDRKALYTKEKAIDSACEDFIDAYEQTQDDWEEALAFEDGAHRVITMILRKPKEASLPHWLDGMEKAVKFMRERLTKGA